MKSIFASLLCSILSMTAQAQYTLQDEDVIVVDGVITEYTSHTEPHIIIPNMLDGQVITAIGNGAFFEKNLSGVDLSELSSLSTIGEYAFAENNLTTLDLSDMVNLSSISRDAFSNNSLVNVNLTGLSNLNRIGLGAFRYNSIRAVDFSDLNNLLIIQAAAFQFNELTEVDFTPLTSLSTIESGAFSYNSLSAVDLTSLTSLTTIGQSAFGTNGTGLVEFTLPTPSIELVGAWIDTQGNPQESGSQVPVSRGYNYTNNDPYTLTSNDVVVVEGEIISYLPRLTYPTIIIPHMLDDQEITSIGENVFYNKELVSVDLSALRNLTNIKESAFEENNIEELDLSGLTNLAEIGFHAFTYHNLTSVDFTDLTSLVVIGEEAFAWGDLTSVDFTGLSNLTSIESQAFAGNLLTSVNLAGLTSLTTIGEGAFGNNGFSEFNLPTPSAALVGEWLDSYGEVYTSGQLVSVSQGYYYTNHDPYTLTSEDVVIVKGELISYLPKMTYTNIIIPNALDDQTITAIGELSFYAKGLSSIDLSELSNLRAIGALAFINNDFGNFQLPTPTTEGYVFDGWESSAGTVYANGATVSVGHEYQAVVTSILTYDITYEADGGTHDNPVTYTIEDELTFSAATKEGHTFEGWFTDAAFTTPITEIPTGSTGDLELFARFTENVLGLADGAPISVVPYPNPVSSRFALEVDIDQIHVVNLGGQVVHTFGERQARYDVAHLAPGSYVLRLFKAGQSVGAARIIIVESSR